VALGGGRPPCRRSHHHSRCRREKNAPAKNDAAGWTSVEERRQAKAKWKWKRRKSHQQSAPSASACSIGRDQGQHSVRVRGHERKPDHGRHHRVS